jgi:hypothetical protein
MADDITAGMRKVHSRSSGIREIEAIPHASALIEGHRDFGYNLETALADLIDNSISAQASRIELTADTTSDEPWIALADNGHGMTEAGLVEAMRLGSKNPTEVRDAKDLGRFGLGLKSASFSQCRSLTVITRHEEKIACARWDLDNVARKKTWSLELLDDLTNVVGYSLLNEQGTVIVWQKLDRLMGGYTHEHAKRSRHINSELSRAEYHLRLVFHRFLERTKPQLRLLLNGRMLKPIDPMASSHPATQKDPEEVLKLEQGNVRIRCHTLPHHKKMGSEEWKEIGGPEGHLKSQGLYIYRENRLIISGGWLGLTRQDELTKLCRISIDIPNTMDAAWKIDVKKASAQLPPVIRGRLKRVIERYVGTSKRTYRSRGQKLVDKTQFPIWNRAQKDGQVIFRPNLEHPVFLAYAEQLPENLREGFERCLRLVGSGLPIETLHAELVGNAEAVATDTAERADLEQMVEAMAGTLIDNGVPLEALSNTMQSHPFLRSNWSLVVSILGDLMERRQYE